jgi:monoamine oxidase
MLPFYKQNIFKSMKPGNYIKFIVTYKKAFWKEMGYSGEVVSDGSIIRNKLNNVNRVSLGPISVMYDNTSYSNEPALLGFIGANAALQWSDLDLNTRKQEIIQSICDYFNTNDAKELLIDYYEKNWNEEVYNGGCPTYNITSNGLMKDYSRALREPFENIHFCGTESASVWQGYMDGAVESALRVKNELLAFF